MDVSKLLLFCSSLVYERREQRVHHAFQIGRRAASRKANSDEESLKALQELDEADRFIIETAAKELDMQYIVSQLLTKQES